MNENEIYAAVSVEMERFRSVRTPDQQAVWDRFPARGQRTRLSLFAQALSVQQPGNPRAGMALVTACRMFCSPAVGGMYNGSLAQAAAYLEQIREIAA
ncbi:MAG: hypothetical protein M3R61_00240 [Chloroflexota bacterium]|nr:hypothetical protein [Chloroflexota bacterium]